MRLPRFGVNFYKIIVGAVFSLIWGKIMYVIWEQPSYLTFIWFYLIVGSIILKWVLFAIIDRIDLKIRIKELKKEIDRSEKLIADIDKDHPHGNDPS